MRSGRAILVFLAAAALAACSSGGATHASVSSPTTAERTLSWGDSTKLGVALRLHSVVALDGSGRPGAEVMSTIENPVTVLAVDHLADDSIIFLECCDDYTTKDGSTLSGAIATLRSNRDPTFALHGIAFGVSTDRTKIAALDNITGKISIYDTRTKSTRSIDTRLVKQAPWIGTPSGKIAWSRDDQHLAFGVDGEGTLVLVDAHDGALLMEAKPDPKHALSSPAVLADGRIVAIDRTIKDANLVAIDARTGTHDVLAPLDRDVVQVAPLPDGHHVLFTRGGDRRLFYVDLDTKAIEDLESKNNYDWIAP